MSESVGTSVLGKVVRSDRSLRNRSRRSRPSNETEDSFLCPKLSVSDTYPQDGETKRHLLSSFLNIHFNIILLPIRCPNYILFYLYLLYKCPIYFALLCVSVCCAATVVAILCYVCLCAVLLPLWPSFVMCVCVLCCYRCGHPLFLTRRI